MQSETQLVFVREDEDSNLWWPAVMGSSHKTIVSTFSSEEEKARFTAMFFRQGWHDSKDKIARIFNYKKYTNRKMFLLIPADKQHDLVREFFASCEDVGISCNEIDGWNEAFFEALHYKIGQDDECSSEPLFGSPGGALYAPESHAAIGQLRQESTDAVGQDVNGGKRKLSGQPAKMTIASPRKKSRCESTEGENMTISVRSRGDNIQSFQTPLSRSYSMQQQSPIPLEKQNEDVPQSNVTLPEHSHNLIVSSGDRKKSAKKVGVLNNHNGPRRYIQKYDEWTTVWEILRESYGWVARKGDGLAEQYYIPGELSHHSLDYLKKNNRLGKDYYASVVDVKRYVREKFLWEGPVSKSLSQSQDNNSSSLEVANNHEHAQDLSFKPEDEEVFGAVPSQKTMKSRGRKKGGEKSEGKKQHMERTCDEPRKKYKIKSDDPWPLVLSTLQFNLQLEYKGYLMMVKSKYHDMSPNQIRKKLIRFEDYFESEEQLKDFAYHNYGWRGPPGKEHVPFDDFYGSRRRQDNCDSDTKQSPASSVASTAQTTPRSTNADGKRGSSKKEKSKTSVSKNDDKSEPIVSTGRLRTTSTKETVKKSNSTSKKKLSTVPGESNGLTVDEKLERSASQDQSGTVSKKDNLKKSSSTRRKKASIVPKETNEIDGTGNSESVQDLDHKDIDEEPNKSLRDRLNTCIRNLHSAHVPKDMFFSGLDSESKVASNENRLMSFLRGCLDLEQKQLHYESSLLYVCGGPGTGKTSMVKHCMEALEKDQNMKYAHSFIKATDIERSPNDLLHTISTMMGKKIGIKKVQQMEKWLTSRLKQGPIFLVIDEIDFLLEKVPSNDSIIAIVLGWASDPNNRLVVVGMSNSVGGDGAKTLHEHFTVFEEIVFEPFSADDLTAIVNKRLGDKNVSLVDKNAVVYASKRAANNRGDAREILKIMSDACSLANDSLSPDQLSDNSTIDSPVVKMPHILKALKKNAEYSKSEIIESLPGNARIILCVAAALGQVGSGWKIIQLRDLKRYCADATAVCEDFSLSVFESSIEQLVDSGLISYDYSYGFFDGDMYDKSIKLGVHLHDVEIALEDTLLKEGSFYSNLVNYVKSHDIVCSDDDEWL